MQESPDMLAEETTHLVSVPLTVHLTLTGPPATLDGVMLRDSGTVDVAGLLAETVRFTVEQHLGEMDVVIEGNDLTSGAPFRATGTMLRVEDTSE
ncbi:hypothetical protein [Egicoccus sp. AB-alg2]|uniref:hypothetical protein n=1 Tax=Egicoccus sp. AB-alg2 TaxID=3242693 RepID=UPI00359D8E47